MTVRRVSQEKVICCRDWMEVSDTQRDQWEWQVIHQLSHSRTTFSLATFMDLANLPADRAGVLVHEARRLKWIWTAGDDLYVGRLRRRR